jgi:hypothetical protein
MTLEQDPETRIEKLQKVRHQIHRQNLIFSHELAMDLFGRLDTLAKGGVVVLKEWMSVIG